MGSFALRQEIEVISGGEPVHQCDSDLHHARLNSQVLFFSQHTQPNNQFSIISDLLRRRRIWGMNNTRSRTIQLPLSSTPMLSHCAPTCRPSLATEPPATWCWVTTNRPSVMPDKPLTWIHPLRRASSALPSAASCWVSSMETHVSCLFAQSITANLSPRPTSWITPTLWEFFCLRFFTGPFTSDCKLVENYCEIIFFQSLLVVQEISELVKHENIGYLPLSESDDSSISYIFSGNLYGLFIILSSSAWHFFT